jgi:hypothetical protein
MASKRFDVMPTVSYKVAENIKAEIAQFHDDLKQLSLRRDKEGDIDRRVCIGASKVYPVRNPCT